jgi:hypothetical protein
MEKEREGGKERKKERKKGNEGGGKKMLMSVWSETFNLCAMSHHYRCPVVLLSCPPGSLERARNVTGGPMPNTMKSQPRMSKAWTSGVGRGCRACVGVFGTDAVDCLGLRDLNDVPEDIR